MAENEDGQEKSLAPSQRRLDQARDEGRVVRSRDLSSAIATFACVGAVVIAGAGIVNSAMGWMRGSFRSASAAAIHHDEGAMLQSLHGLVTDALMVMAPVIIATMAAGILGSMGIGGLVLSTKALEPDFSRLSPIKGLGRMFSLHGLGELVKSVLKVLVLGSVAGLLVWNGMQGWLNLVLPSPRDAMAALGAMLTKHALVLAGSLFLIAAADVPFQWWSFHKNLRMTLEEAKQEGKESEGDPRVKGKIRQIMRDRARKRMMQNVPKADVVVTNPTHYAVALQYNDGMAAPRVLAKGADAVAARIRELAAEHEIAVVESPKLARALHQHCDVDREVPVALYRAVAQVLAYVYQLREYVSGPSPELPPVEIPAGWDPLDENPLRRGGRPARSNA